MNSCAHCKNSFKKKYSKQRFCSVICSNRSNLNHKNEFIAPNHYSEELAEIFGIMLGDGSMTNYFAKISLNRIADQGYDKNIIGLIRHLFPKTTVAVYDQPKQGVQRLQISSKDFCDYFRSIGFDPKRRTVPAWILQNTLFKKATVRGLFDTEGSIGVKRSRAKNGEHIYKQLTVTNLNPNILKFLERTLQELGFSPTKNSRKNIYISNRKDIRRYFKIVGTSNPKLEKKALF